MRWRALADAPDGVPPKLGNLAVAARAGIAVPPTVWLPAADAVAASVPTELGDGALIVRSASPTEDLAGSSQAGRFHTEVVPDPRDDRAFARVVGAVIASLPRDADGHPTGCTFVQPCRTPERGGVAFFDGFYFERTSAPGGNAALTSGRERGDVERGHLRRGDAWSEWLTQVHTAFGATASIDVEYVEDGGAYELLQSRPAAFALRRNPTLSLANHREILGETPSPWIVSAVVEAGRDATRFFAEADPRIEPWREPYAVELVGRAWMCFGFFYRLMDHWGLPRAWVTEGVGGAADGPDDARLDVPRMLRNVVPLVRLQWRSLRTVMAARRELDRLRGRVTSAHTLPELFEANVLGMEIALRTNFALGGMLSGAARLRSALGIRGRPRVVTAEMMRGYDALRSLPDVERARGLDDWLARHGHRGPLESDPRQPRFREMRAALSRDLSRRVDDASDPGRPGSDAPWFALERRREWFRDELMRIWSELRARVLAEGVRLVASGALNEVDDVFHLRAADLREQGVDLAERAASNRASVGPAHRLRVPLTASRDEIEALRDGADAGPRDRPDGALRGIGLGPDAAGSEVFRGTVRRMASVADALADDSLDAESVLVVTALEPSWALVFGRVGAVVAEIGGELSHASILLREAAVPAVVNCADAWDRLSDGDRVEIDSVRGSVRCLERVPVAAVDDVPGRA